MTAAQVICSCDVSLNLDAQCGVTPQIQVASEGERVRSCRQLRPELDWSCLDAASPASASPRRTIACALLLDVTWAATPVQARSGD
jgi:hypothetical protein